MGVSAYKVRGHALAKTAGHMYTLTRFTSTLVGLLYVALSVLTWDTPSVGALNEKRYEAAKLRELSPRVPRRKKILDPSPRVQNITFSNPIASRVQCLATFG